MTLCVQQTDDPLMVDLLMKRFDPQDQITVIKIKIDLILREFL